MSCVSKLVHEKEVEKLLFFLSLVDFSKVPKAV